MLPIIKLLLCPTLQVSCCVSQPVTRKSAGLRGCGELGQPQAAAACQAGGSACGGTRSQHCIAFVLCRHQPSSLACPRVAPSSHPAAPPPSANVQGPPWPWPPAPWPAACRPPGRCRGLLQQCEPSPRPPPGTASTGQLQRRAAASCQRRPPLKPCCRPCGAGGRPRWSLHRCAATCSAARCSWGECPSGAWSWQRRRALLHPWLLAHASPCILPPSRSLLVAGGAGASLILHLNAAQEVATQARAARPRSVGPLPACCHCAAPPA